MFRNLFILGVIGITRIFAEICTTNCISFTVAAGTGCAWMCNYCADQLKTNNYYFTTPVCTYQPGGCVGNPMSGVEYTCCSN